jgi:CubicO group peptidase (beta-lactamase class C family)
LTASRAARALLALALAAAALVAAACIAYPPEYVWRVLAWRDADADDHTRFPMRRIAPAAGAAPLPLGVDKGTVMAAWLKATGNPAMESHLAELGTQSFVVLHGGEIVYEGYFNGGAADAWVTSFSVAKSILSALVGIAVAEGAIALDDPVTRHLPELRQRDARFDAVTLRHLVRMASGIRYREFPFLHGDDAKTYYYPDLRALALEHSRIDGPPGRSFHYNNYHPLLLGMVLERATKMPVAQYAERKLWQPAGMASPASWSLDSTSSGFEKMESGFNATARDFARFGQLMLQEGRMGDRQVLPKAWAIESTAPDAAPPPPGYYDASPWTRGRRDRYYQAFWWGQRRPGGGYDFAARGNHGQFIFVSPANEVVIARNGWRYGMEAQQWFDLAQRMADELGPRTALASLTPAR